MPAASSRPSISAALRPGTWHVDQVGVNAPGSETTSALAPLRNVDIGFGASGVLPAKPVIVNRIKHGVSGANKNKICGMRAHPDAR